MLVLTRKVGEEIVIGDNIRIVVVGIQANKVRIGISAPNDVVVDREEIHHKRRHSISDVPVHSLTPASLIDTVALNSPEDKATEKSDAAIFVTKGAQPVEAAQASMDRETIGFDEQRRAGANHCRSTGVHSLSTKHGQIKSGVEAIVD